MSGARKILIIDDERILHVMLRSVFMTHGFEVVSAYTGEEGISSAVSEKPDLIILDVMLPGIKGREVCRQIKLIEGLQDIPVFFLTAKDSTDEVEAEQNLGAIGHMTKPINSMVLVREIKKILGDG